jgi:hypothetical protein
MYTPGPSVVTPKILAAVAAIRYKLPVLSVRNHVLRCEKVWNVNASLSIFIVPSKRGKIRWLSQIHLVLAYRNHSIWWIIDALDRIGPHSLLSGRWMK